MTSLFSDVILIGGGDARRKWGMLKGRGLATLQMVVWEGSVFKFYGETVLFGVEKNLKKNIRWVKNGKKKSG